MKRYNFVLNEKQEKFAEELLSTTLFDNHKQFYIFLLEQYKQKQTPAYVKAKKEELDFRKVKSKTTTSIVDTIYNKLESFILPVGFDFPSSSLASDENGTTELEATWSYNDIPLPLEEPMFVMNQGIANKNILYPLKMATYVEKNTIDLHKLSLKNEKYHNSFEGERFNQEYWMWKILRDHGYSYDEAVEIFE